MVDVEPVKPAPKLQVLQSRTLAEIPFVAHGLTRRVAGLGVAEGNVAYGGGRDRDEAWEMRRAWCNAIELDAETLVTVQQVHGVEVAAAAREDAGRGAVPGSSPLATADAIISAESGVALMTLHADCLPILLCAPDVPAIAAVHAGWRGTVAGVTARTVEALKREYGAVPDRTIAYLGPTNRGCCYEVGSEVVEGWLDYDPGDSAGALSQRGDRWYFDVALANRWALLAHGFRPGNIETSGICTQCASDQWFSHRAQGPDTGRFGAIIALR
ncbi:MAG: purine-nucleoside/S-methyl-5-thioadenosine phosphorylase / adenosine deaminase [Thermomicrobiales bacterium]|nr:purine-nucleoside/S-methyl-5-thioadenosine phosphorylase / adenosine deaminase [Thermomicrobiales bacterium]